MHPAVVVGLVSSFEVSAVVERADFIAVVQQRDAAEGHDHAVQQQDHVDAAVCSLVAALQCALQPGQGGERAGDAGIAGLVVAAEGLAAGGETP